MTIITIPKELDLHFFGRNGPGRMCGAEVLAYGDTLDISPITSRGIAGRCRIPIPVAQVEEFIQALRAEVRRLRPSNPPSGTTDLDDLIERFGHWGDHPDYPRSDWQYLVANGDTQRGYWEHVLVSIEIARHDASELGSPAS